MASAEKVEKVVKPPRKPVVNPNRHSIGMGGSQANAATANPINNPPTQFAMNVPNGNVGHSKYSLQPQPPAETSTGAGTEADK